MKYTKEEMLSKVDHTLLKPEATWPQIQTLCDEAVANHCASVCINTCYVKQAVEYMAGRVPVCCVVGFPLGAMDTASKAFEAKTAVENGASEVDMVINIGWLKNKQYDDVRNDIAAVKAAVGDKVLKVIIETCLLTEEEKIKMCDIVPEAGADFIKTSTGFSTGGATFHDIALFAEHVRGRCKIKAAVGDKVLKVIIETCLLTEEEKIKMCDIVPEAGADFIKTSTGFSTGGATFHDIALFAEHVRGRCKIKAAGGISTVEDIEKFLDLGADRLGTSRAVKLLTSGEAGSGY